MTHSRASQDHPRLQHAVPNKEGNRAAVLCMSRLPEVSVEREAPRSNSTVRAVRLITGVSPTSWQEQPLESGVYSGKENT